MVSMQKVLLRQRKEPVDKSRDGSKLSGTEMEFSLLELWLRETTFEALSIYPVIICCRSLGELQSHI